jgi:preprotein translocase subunit SecB
MRGSLNHTVEIDQATFDAARQLIVCAELQSVRLATCKMSTKPRAQNPENDVSLKLRTKADGRKIDEKTLLCEFSFSLNATHESADSRPLEISLTLEAAYTIPSDVVSSSKQIKAFATTNGMLNVWPYWREFVQSITNRAGLPPLTLPLFRVQYVKPPAPKTP